MVVFAKVQVISHFFLRFQIEEGSFLSILLPHRRQKVAPSFAVKKLKGLDFSKPFSFTIGSDINQDEGEIHNPHYLLFNFTQPLICITSSPPAKKAHEPLHECIKNTTRIHQFVLCFNIQTFSFKLSE